MSTNRRQADTSATASLHWRLAGFDQLDPSTLYALLSARVAVFVVEQRCAYQELDGLDGEALHLYAIDGDEQICAYARLLPPGSRYPEPSIGRVLSTGAHRGRGLGRALMERAIDTCRSHWPEAAIRVSAQHHLEAFYASLGFETISPPYDEDGIPHIDMRRNVRP